MRIIVGLARLVMLWIILSVLVLFGRLIYWLVQAGTLAQHWHTVAILLGLFVLGTAVFWGPFLIGPFIYDPSDGVTAFWSSDDPDERRAAHDEKETHYVYVASTNAPHNYYKIGYSKDPQQRINALGTASPYDFRIVFRFGPFSEEKARLLEQDLHKDFEDKRGEREWFALDEEDLKFLKEYEPSAGVG